MTSKSIQAKQIKETVSMVNLLSRLGFEPIKVHGQEHKYYSMLRDENNPSFYVNETIGAWYDQGLGKGGNVIDFALAYWKLPFPDTLEKIVAVCGVPLQQPNATPTRRCHVVKTPHYQVEEIKELGTNPAITDYLHERGIWEAAQGHLKEIYYFVDDQKQQRKYFFAAGWLNEQGIWELRNRYFQCSLGPKAISCIPGAGNRVVLFEGYMDYLSWLTENPGANESVIVLNSVSLLKSGIEKALQFDEVLSFLDRDEAGMTATVELSKAIPHAVDCSAIYDGYKDYNDKLRGKSRQQDNPVTR